MEAQQSTDRRDRLPDITASNGGGNKRSTSHHSIHHADVPSSDSEITPTASRSDDEAYKRKMESLDRAEKQYEKELKTLELKERAAAKTQKKKKPKEKKRDPFPHRHYQALHPTTNKLLGKRWEEKDFKVHELKLSKVKPTIDTSSPKRYPHLERKRKRVQLETGNIIQHEEENRKRLSI